MGRVSIKSLGGVDLRKVDWQRVDYQPRKVTSCNCSRVVGCATNDPEVGPLLTSTIMFELPVLLPSFTLTMNLYLEPGVRTLALRTREVNDVPVALY